jgi:hypothetical protein
MFRQNGRLHEKTKEFNDLYKLSEQAYKTVQPIVLKIDDKIHNEFRYCARGLMELLAEATNESVNEEEALSKLQRATHAIRNALNDSIDLIVGYGSSQIRKMSLIENERNMQSFVPDINDIIRAIRSVSNEISKSRSNLENRVVIYSKILESEDFIIIRRFCEKSDIIMNSVVTENMKLRKERQRFIVGVLLTSLGILASIIGIIFKLPEFLTWLFTTFPNLHLLGLEKYF